MREIRFRAWYKHTPIMIYVDPKATHESVGRVKSNAELFRLAEINIYDLMQYTGLKDKNGVEIYEGDLFSAWDERSYYAVQWNEQSTGFHLVWVKGAVGDSKSYHYFEMLMAEYQFEPVGNIYENPELLKKEVIND